MDRLAQAQARTEKRLEKTDRRARRDQEVARGAFRGGGLYGLEDRAIKGLPEVLRRDYGLELLERFSRGYLRDTEGRVLEVNILGRTRRDGFEVLIIGEVKSQLSKEEVGRFLRCKLERLEGIAPEIFPAFVTYMTT